MSPSPLPLTLPESYNSLPFTQIRTSHHTRDPSIIILTLYRPQHHNAFTSTMQAELETAYALFDRDDRVRCVVMTGGEGKIFCAGADLDEGFKRAEGEGVEEHRDGGGRVALAIHHCRKPSIAAIQGSAVGVGITMTLPMNIRIVSSTAKIGFVFARRGLVMEAVSSFYLPRLIGHSRAMQAVTTGSTYPATHKVWDGLFAETCERPDQVLPRALELAEEVAANTSSVSTYLMKELMYRDQGSPEAQHLLDSRILFQLFGSPDNKEGVDSFMEKRPANFKGTMDNIKLTGYPWWIPVDTSGRPKVAPTGGSKI